MIFELILLVFIVIVVLFRWASLVPPSVQHFICASAGHFASYLSVWFTSAAVPYWWESSSSTLEPDSIERRTRVFSILSKFWFRFRLHLKKCFQTYYYKLHNSLIHQNVIRRKRSHCLSTIHLESFSKVFLNVALLYDAISFMTIILSCSNLKCLIH